MPTVSVELRNVAGTEAALGWASAHTIVVHRPEVMRAAVVWGSTALSCCRSRSAVVSAMTFVTSHIVMRRKAD